MVEQQHKQVPISPEIQQALGKLDVRMADLMEQINIVSKVLIEENGLLQAKFDSLQFQQQYRSKEVSVK